MTTSTSAIAFGDERLPARFWAKVSVDSSTDCWIWTGSRHPQGYGQIQWAGAAGKTHRVSYTALVGEIPPGLHIDHLCRVRACCNPTHLEPVTHSENVRRGNQGKPQRDKTHCVNGHEFTEANTRRWRNKRLCRLCARTASLAYYHRRQAAARASASTPSQ